MVFIIGGGGVGSQICPTLCMLIGKQKVTVVDGDKLETKNLNRQLFDANQVGQNKAEALAAKYGCKAIPEWYSNGTVQHERGDWLMVCVDNNAARKSALEACDHFRCRAIFAANETWSAEAYVYLPTWYSSRRDPRVFIPEILSDETNDPRAGAAGCTGHAQEQNPQLVTSNMSAAALAAGLFALWAVKLPELERETIPFLPMRRVINMSRMEETKVGED